MEAADARGLLGVLLSDGSMTRYSTPAGGYVQLTLTAGASASAFLEEKVSEINYFLLSEAQIIPYDSKPRANGSTSTVLRFRISTNKLRPIYNLLYPNGFREITQTALDMLGGHCAGWLWASGAKNSKGGSSVLSRVGTTDEEALMVSSWLQMLTGAASRIDRDSGGIKPRLFFSPAESRKIRQSLISYAPNTRRHLFLEDVQDVSSIRSARTELLLGEGDDCPEGSQQEAMAGAAAH